MSNSMHDSPRPAWLIVVFLLILLCCACNGKQSQALPIHQGRLTPTESQGSVIKAADTSVPSATPVKPTQTFTPTMTITATNSPSQTPTTVIPALIQPPENPCEVGSGFGSNCDNDIDKPALSIDGRLALSVNGMLYVEVEPASGQFVLVDKNARDPVWASEGKRLLYSVWDAAASETIDFRIYQVSDKNAKSLTKIIPGFPEPPYDGMKKIWSPDGRLIYLWSIDPINMVVPVVADLANYDWYNLDLPCVRYCWLWPTSQERFIWQEHCGAPCEMMTGYDTYSQTIWPEGFETRGMFALTPDLHYLINFGATIYDPSTQAGQVYRQASPESGILINTETGAIRILWDNIQGLSLAYVIPPQISPDARYVSFNTTSSKGLLLHVIDLRGNSLLELPGVQVLSWKADGDLAVDTQTNKYENRLDLYKIGVNEPVNILPSEAVWITNAAWSPDGTRLAFTVYRSEAKAGALYLWSAADQNLTIAAEHPIEKAPGCIQWMTEGQGVYYTLGYAEGCTQNSSVWQYLIETGQSRLVAESANP